MYHALSKQYHNSSGLSWASSSLYFCISGVVLAFPPYFSVWAVVAAPTLSILVVSNCQFILLIPFPLDSLFCFLSGIYLAQFLCSAPHNCPSRFLWLIKEHLFPWGAEWKSDPPWLSLHSLVAPSLTNNLCSCVPGISKEACHQEELNCFGYSQTL